MPLPFPLNFPAKGFWLAVDCCEEPEDIVEKKKFFLGMGRRGKSRQVGQSEAEQEKSIMDAAARSRKMCKEKKLKESCKPIVKKSNEVLFYGANHVSSFTYKDFETCVPELMIQDMSHVLLEDYEIALSKVGESMANEDDLNISFYLRTVANSKVFARVQHMIEFLHHEPHCDRLHGWIAQIGPLFMMGSSTMSLDESVDQVKTFVGTLMSFDDNLLAKLSEGLAAMQLKTLSVT